MFNNNKSFLYTFDLLGITPQMRIFNTNSYKSIISSYYINYYLYFFYCIFNIFIYNTVNLKNL